jgi:hypothetical protein
MGLLGVMFCLLKYDDPYNPTFESKYLLTTFGKRCQGAFGFMKISFEPVLFPTFALS